MNATAQQLQTNFPPISGAVADLLPELALRLEAETYSIAGRRDVLLAAVARVPEITDDGTSGKVADFLRQMAEHVKTATAWKDDAKKPVLALDRAIMEQLKALATPVEDARAKLNLRQTAYLVTKEARERKAREEAERVAREAAMEAERLAQEAAAKAQTDADLDAAITAEQVAQEAAAKVEEAVALAHAKPADLTRITGALGTTTSLGRKWDFLPETINMQAIDLESLRPYLSPEDLHKAIRGAIRSGRREIKGVTIKELAKAR